MQILDEEWNYKGSIDAQGKACGRGAAVSHSGQSCYGYFFIDMLHGIGKIFK